MESERSGSFWSDSGGDWKEPSSAPPQDGNTEHTVMSISGALTPKSPTGPQPPSPTFSSTSSAGYQSAELSVVTKTELHTTAVASTSVSCSAQEAHASQSQYNAAAGSTTVPAVAAPAVAAPAAPVPTPPPTASPSPPAPRAKVGSRSSSRALSRVSSLQLTVSAAANLYGNEGGATMLDYDSGVVHAVPPKLLDQWEGEVRSVRSSSNRASAHRPMTAGALFARHPGPGMYADNVDEASSSQHGSATSGPVDLLERHPLTWSVDDVVSWVDHISLGQYRRRFQHHQMNGRMLLQLGNNPALIAQLGIAPLGHRIALQEAAEELATAWSYTPPPVSPPSVSQRGSSASRPLRPYSAMTAASPSARGGRRPMSSRAPQTLVLPEDHSALDPASRASVVEMHGKLRFLHSRASARAQQYRTSRGQLAAVTIAAEDEAAYLSRLLGDLERQHGSWLFAPAAAADGSQQQQSWRPASASAPGTQPGELYNPNTPAPRRMSSAHTGPSFLARLAADLKMRASSKKELERKMYDSVQPDPSSRKKDRAMCESYVQKTYGIGLGDSQEEYEETIDGVCTQYRETFASAGVTRVQVEAALKAKGEKKLSAAASIFRTMLFMERYKHEEHHRKESIVELRSKYWKQIMGSKDNSDAKNAAKYFSRLGWTDPEDPSNEQRIVALVRRARAYKKEVDAWKEKNRERVLAGTAGPAPEPAIDWSSAIWAVDGLGRLQQDQMDRLAARAAAAAGANTAVATPHAPSGQISVVDGGGEDHLMETVRLLAGKTDAELDKVESAASLIAAYRAVRTQMFLNFTLDDIRSRDVRMQHAYESLGVRMPPVEGGRVEEFLERQAMDAAKRTEKQEKERLDKLAKEGAIVNSSAIYNSRPRTAR